MPKVFQRAFLALHTTLYRLSGGRLMSTINGLPVLLLTARGRRTGKSRTVPVLFLRDGDDYLVCASYAGAPKHPAWYLNARDAGEATIRVGGDRVVVETQGIEDGPRRGDLYARFQAASDVFAGYERKTDRTFPVMILSPRSA